ncbi:CD1247 N-terminal domain-containing protein [Caldisalinibacter kiritimatiensis]|uniref:Uncharacterized protein n=1 Tax=Caldisalinibacter kiritimatiensis TaxID=1304284 RepID=R1CBR3_9FIRM|nr:CD1247 N-terminal domain-containing protein [Caldisalinibacter kiritimatiensis]EOC99759.1 hypothetical protein L21TH_2206 [Caldisalinibacter kiritimatiensis]
MDYLYERISYLRGLAEGLEVDESSKEGKLMLHIIDTLEDLADAVAEVVENQEDLSEYVELMDEDLTDVEDELFGELDEEYYYDEYDPEYLDEDLIIDENEYIDDEIEE